MFTGIVEETGKVLEIAPAENSIRLKLRARITAQDMKRGDSLAVNGCCLTAISIKKSGAGASLQFDLLRETWQRTNLQFVKAGSLVNLERPLAANGRLHGHFVTGHIDGVGQIRTFEKKGQDWRLEIACPRKILKYVVYKGSIAIDGISLTVAEVKKGSFTVWIIPHTYEVTALKERKVGDTVNLEADLLAKYAEKFASTRR